MKNLNLQYKYLKTDILSALRDKINNSDIESAHSKGKCIKVNIFDYTEMVIIKDCLMFLDDEGRDYHLYNGDCSIEDFIDILNN